jgi:hypothetical protein
MVINRRNSVIPGEGAMMMITVAEAAPPAAYFFSTPQVRMSGPR